MKKEKLWSATFVAILAFIFFNQIAGAGLNTGTSVYLESTGKGAALAGLGALVYSFGAAVFRISIGPVVDKRGRGIVMMAAAVFFLIGSLGPLLVNDGVFFVIWRIVQGFGIAAGATAAYSASADVVPMSRLGESVAYSATSQAIAMSVGPMLAVTLASSDIPASMYVAIAIASFCMGISAFLGRYEKNPAKLPATSSYRLRWEKGKVGAEEGGADEPQAVSKAAGRTGKASDAGTQRRSLKQLLGNLFEFRALSGAIPNVCLAPAYAFSLFYAGVFGGVMGVGNPGAYYMLSALAMLAVRFLTGRLFDTTPPLRLMAVASIVGFLSFVLTFSVMFIGAPLCSIAFYGAGICYGVCVGIVTPLGLSVAMKQVPENRWGAATAFYYFVFDIAIGIVSALFGAVIDSFGYMPIIICTMVFVVLSFVSAAIGFPKKA